MADHPFRENPFAAPEAAVDDYIEGTIVVDEGTGPPWEQPGPWVKRFFATMWLCYRHPFLLFRGLRRRGSWWMPVAYYVVAVLLVNGIVLVLVQAPGGIQQLGIETGESAEMEVLGMAGYAVLIVVAHVMLRVLGSCQPFVTTFRAMFYVTGSVAPVVIVPWIGAYLAFPYYLVVMGIAIQATHDLSMPRVGCAMLATCVIVFLAVAIVFIAGVLAGIIPEPT
jgi:hypothetical protein